MSEDNIPTLLVDDLFDQQRLENAKRWHVIAIICGYNHLARTAKTLGEKAYFRIACDEVEKEHIADGGDPVINHDGEEIILTLERATYVKFNSNDIEQMRLAVLDYDREQNECESDCTCINGNDMTLVTTAVVNCEVCK
jgi:hypothetical protein